MNAIPWYQSPVMIGLVVSVISGLLGIFNMGDKIATEEVAKYVDMAFQLIAVGAAAFSGWKRKRSTIQPLTLTKEGANAASLPKCHPLAVSFAVLAAVLLLDGCAVTQAVSRAETIEQRAAALIGDFTIFQSAAKTIGSDTTVPDEVRARVLDAAITAKPAVDRLDELLRSYRLVAGQLAAGATTEDKVKIAATNLSAWILEVAPKIKSLRTTIEGARP